MKKWWILNYARPIGPAPEIYEDNPPTQTIERIWCEEREDYIEDPYQEGSPEAFLSEFSALKYLKECGHLVKDIKIFRTNNKLKILKDPLED